MSSSSLLHKTSSHRLYKHHYHQHQTLRHFIDSRIKWVRDRALDHVVEKEKNLKPMLSLKNFIKSEPSKSIPISIAADNKTNLSLPTRAIDFIRKYPSIFQEFVPTSGNVSRPHVRLTNEVISLDEEEESIYQRESYREDVANRLLKLLMLTRVNKLPIDVLERLKWDLGLPQDYVKSLVTDFPDYFQVSSIRSGNEDAPCLGLEVVCWTDELAASVMEKKARKDNLGFKKGMPLAFPLQYSRGYDLEKKVKTWLDEWQKLPYLCPYEDFWHLQSKSDQAEKWTVAVLHELLNLFVSKKTDRENIFCLGEYLGFGSRFKRALINHPGIFYVSNKIRTHTAVLRDGFKRDLLVEKNPIMSMRYQYIHLMNKEAEQVKSTVSLSTSTVQKRTPRADEEGEMEAGAEDEDEDSVENDNANEEEDEDANEEEDEDEDEDEAEEDDDDDDELGARRNDGRGRTGRNAYGRVETKVTSRTSDRASSNRRGPNMVGDRVPTPPSRGSDRRRRDNAGMRSPGRTSYSRTRGDEGGYEVNARQSVVRGRIGRNEYGRDETKTPSFSSDQGSSNRRGFDMVGDRVSTSPSRGSDHRRGDNAGMRSPGIINYSRTRRDEGDYHMNPRQSGGRGRMGRNEYGQYGHTEAKTSSFSSDRSSSNRRGPNRVGDRVPTPPSGGADHRNGYNVGGRSPGRTNHSRSSERLRTEKISQY